MISVLARALLIAGWFVAEDDVAYGVIAFVIGLVFLALTIAFELYVHPLQKRGSKP